MKKALKPSFRISDDFTLALGNIVRTALTGNGYFPAPQPNLSTLQSAITAFSDSLAKAEYGSRMDIAKKNADKKNLITFLRSECDYINEAAKGNVVILSTCGLPLSKDRQAKVLGIPVAKVQLGASGELILSTAAVFGALCYLHQYTTDPNAALWPAITSTKAKCKIEGLQPGTIYSLRIVAIGTNGQVTMSDVITRMVA